MTQATVKILVSFRKTNIYLFIFIKIKITLASAHRESSILGRKKHS
jgi:hypothetical protein